jgi:hypothetical protein
MAGEFDKIGLVMPARADELYEPPLTIRHNGARCASCALPATKKVGAHEVTGLLFAAPAGKYENAPRDVFALTLSTDPVVSS